MDSSEGGRVAVRTRTQTLQLNWAGMSAWDTWGQSNTGHEDHSHSVPESHYRRREPTSIVAHTRKHPFPATVGAVESVHGTSTPLWPRINLGAVVALGQSKLKRKGKGKRKVPAPPSEYSPKTQPNAQDSLHTAYASNREPTQGAWIPMAPKVAPPRLSSLTETQRGRRPSWDENMPVLPLLIGAGEVDNHAAQVDVEIADRQRKLAELKAMREVLIAQEKADSARRRMSEAKTSRDEHTRPSGGDTVYEKWHPIARNDTFRASNQSNDSNHSILSLPCSDDSGSTSDEYINRLQKDTPVERHGESDGRNLFPKSYSDEYEYVRFWSPSLGLPYASTNETQQERDINYAENHADCLSDDPPIPPPRRRGRKSSDNSENQEQSEQPNPSPKADSLKQAASASSRVSHEHVTVARGRENEPMYESIDEILPRLSTAQQNDAIRKDGASIASAFGELAVDESGTFCLREDLLQGPRRHTVDVDGRGGGPRRTRHCAIKTNVRPSSADDDTRFEEPTYDLASWKHKYS